VPPQGFNFLALNKDFNPFYQRDVGSN